MLKDPTLELTLSLLRHPDSAATLWIVDENLSPDVLLQLRPFEGLQLLTNRYDIAETFKAQGFSVNFSDYDFDQLIRFDRIVYRISKEKLLVHHCINRGLEQLTGHGQLILVGNKQDGIKSIVKNAADCYQLNTKAEKHGSSYVAHLSKPAASHLGELRLDDNEYSTLREINTHAQMSFWSKPGVFGWEKIDRGSQLLVSSLPEVCKYVKSVDSMIDLGCGWGYLTLASAGMSITRRVATDNNAAAVAAAHKNFLMNGLEVECVADDCAGQIRGRFDLIVCNPPFHQGFSVSEHITRKFLKAASRLSRRSTRAVFVVNQFIPLDKLAADYFSQIRVMAHADGFMVYELRP
jgi:16S rRNA (guanine1207-N2)-methyltransferase